MIPNDNSAPLTFDELTQLAIVLAERGQPEALFSVIGRVALETVKASYGAVVR
jgi:hypothetical protein